MSKEIKNIIQLPLVWWEFYKLTPDSRNKLYGFLQESGSDEFVLKIMKKIFNLTPKTK